MVTEPVTPTHICATLTPLAASSSENDTQRLQAAIDHCQAGSSVKLSGGWFFSGPLNMKSGVTLWLARGTVLAASTNPHDYDKNGHCGTIDDRGQGCRPFIHFDSTQGGGIVGEGLIDGQGGQLMYGHGETWWQLARRAQKEGGRQNVPRLIEIDHAHDITFYQVTLRNAPGFHVALNATEGATFWSVRIDTPADSRNTDGIDPGASRDITIAHSFIRTGDDNVSIKAGHSGPTSHVSLLDNHFYWGHGMSIGSETVGGVSDILVRDLTLDGTTSGLRIKSDASRGGVVSGILYEHVCMRGNRRPLDFDTHYDAGASGLKIPVYRNIILRDVGGGAGELIFRGYDATHPLSITLDGVHFGSAARWLVKSAQLQIGNNGVSPPMPESAYSTSAYSHADCTVRWKPFPTTSNKIGAAK
ncbi:glycoside hydrolase family 28 protein [Rahnella perminowiae]|uniref:glycoside hydrolase family 28 protein n=1 Tax=Rahnella TaxID=34037 RepID=UPI0020B696D3|nr:glycosyl hydrolase family 28 protein [Rahnella aceris]